MNPLKLKSYGLAILVTSALVFMITSLSYLVSKNHEVISDFFGNGKKDKLISLHEKIDDIQSKGSNKANELNKSIQQITDQLERLNQKYAKDQLGIEKKLQEINSIQSNKIATKDSTKKIIPKVDVDDNEEIKLEELEAIEERPFNQKLDISVNEESINKEFLKFTSSIQSKVETGKDFGDIESVINDASEYNPEVIKKGFDVESLRSSIAVAESANYPTVDFSGRAGQEYNWKESTSQDTKKSYRRDEFSIIAKQNLYDGGQSDAEINRVKAGFQSGVYQLSQVKQDIALRAAFVYLDVIRYREILNQATIFVQSNFQSAYLAKLRYDRRVSDAGEFQEINGLLENSKANFISAFNNFEDSRSRFKSIVGYLPTYDFPTKDLNLDLINQLMIPDSIDQMVNVSVLKHPTLLSAQQDIEEAKYQYKRTAAEGSPIVDLELSGIRTDNEYYGGSGTSDRRYGNAMLTLKYNIFDGGRIKSKKSEKFQLVKSAEARYEQQKREVEDSSRLAWRSYVSLLRQQIPIKKELESAMVTEAVYERQFSVGRTQLVDVADKREISFETHLISIGAKFDFLYSGFRVLHACGDILILIDSKESKKDICK